MDAALSPLRQRGIHILNYLDDWLVLAQSEVELLSHRSLLLSHLECLGLKINLAKSTLHPSRRISFLGAFFDLTQMRAIVSQIELWQYSGSSFKIGASQNISENARPYGLSIPSVKVRPTSYAAPSLLAETTGSISCVVVDQACVETLIPWKNLQWMERGMPLGMVCRRKVVMTDATNTGWVALYDGKPAFSLWTKAQEGIHINCLVMLAVCRGLQFFLPDLKGHHVLVRSDSMTVIGGPSGVSSAQPLFTEGNARTRQAEPGCGYAITKQCFLWGLDASSTGGPEHLGDLWQGGDNSHCPMYYSKDRDDWLLLYAFPLTSFIPEVLKRVREQKHKLLLVAPLWRNQHWFLDLGQLLVAAPWPIPLRRDLLSQANGTIWHPQPKLRALHL
ncbi:hypothetical protein M9458_043123, partial [Cirrhinus mrigala]